MEGIQTFKGSWPWPWPWIRPYGIPSCITHRPLPIYGTKFHWNRRNFLWTDGRTYGRTYGHFSPSNIIRSTFGSRPKNSETHFKIRFTTKISLDSASHTSHHSKNSPNFTDNFLSYHADKCRQTDRQTDRDRQTETVSLAVSTYKSMLKTNSVVHCLGYMNSFLNCSQRCPPATIAK